MSKRVLVIAMMMAMLTLTGSALADNFQVLLNTGGLVSANYTLDFYLLGGSGGADGNTSITLSNFTFGTGSSGGSVLTGTGASGSLASGVHLTDTDFFGEFQQSFTSGDYVSFNVNYTGSADAGGVPDLFAFLIDELNSSDGSGANSLLTLEFNSATPDLHIYTATSYANFDNLANGPTPIITPEPASLLLLGSGVVVPWLRRRKAKA